MELRPPQDHSGLLGIGAFSRASLLSIKQLRAYHRAGLIEPVAVDPQTGYRFYHWSQLTDAAVIRRLRAVDLPLDQVRDVLRSGDPQVTGDILERHLATMRARLEETARAVNDLQEAVQNPEVHTPVHVKKVEPMSVLTLSDKVREADLAGFLGDAYPRLNEAADRLGVTPTGPTGALYPHVIADDIEEVTAYLPISSPPPPSRAERGRATGEVVVLVEDLPADEVAVAVHQGPYETIGDSYRLLGTWVAQHAEPAPSPVREIYVVSYDETDDPSRFRTEILWPIRPEPA